MPFDVAGNFTRSYNFQQDRDNGIKILAARVDGEFDNFATGMNAVFFRDGRVPMQADLRMNINRITGLADGARWDRLRSSSARTPTRGRISTASAGTLSASTAFSAACLLRRVTLR
jgi:hypothetical protein